MQPMLHSSSCVAEVQIVKLNSLSFGFLASDRHKILIMIARAPSAGETREQERDISVRSGRRYKGSNIDSMRGWSSVHGASRANQYLLKPSGTALMLSEMAPGVTTPDDSWR